MFSSFIASVSRRSDYYYDTQLRDLQVKLGFYSKNKVSSHLIFRINWWISTEKKRFWRIKLHSTMTTTTTMDYLEALTNIMEWQMQEQEQDLPLDCKLKTNKNNKMYSAQLLHSSINIQVVLVYDKFIFLSINGRVGSKKL